MSRRPPAASLKAQLNTIPNRKTIFVATEPRSAAPAIAIAMPTTTDFLQGDSGLLFTNLPRDDVERLFREFQEHDTARTGSTATESIFSQITMPYVELKEGPPEQFTHEMEPFLRKQGLLVRLNKGVVELVADHVVCEEGKPLSPEATNSVVSWDTDVNIPSIPCVPLVV